MITTIPVYNTKGVTIDTYKGRYAFPYLFPSLHVAVLDFFWTDGTFIPEIPTVEQIEQVYLIHGIKYRACWAWGSGVKDGRVFLVDQDVIGDLDLPPAGAQRFGRWQAYNGYYGFLKDNLRIKVVPAGSMTEFGPTGDGFGFMSENLWKRSSFKRRQIVLGKTKESYQWWQRIPWSQELEQELTPELSAKIERLKDPLLMLVDAPASYDEKRRLVEIDERMILHPFVANALARQTAEFMATAATTVDLKPEYKIGVPTELPVMVWPGHSGMLSVSRFPINSNSSIWAGYIDKTPEYERECERIEKLKTCQWSLSTSDSFAKGVSGIVPMDEWDMIITDADIKFGELSGEIILSIGAQWKEGSAFGINLEWGSKKQQWDADGDAGHLKDLNRKPVLFQVIQDLPNASSVKLDKDKTPISVADRRTELILFGMSNMIGRASRFDANTHQTDNRYHLARSLGFLDENELDDKINELITIGTDGLKTTVDWQTAFGDLASLNSRAVTFLGQAAQWTKWPNKHAFTSYIPSVGTEGVEGKNKLMDAIKPWQDGSIANIARIMLPEIESIAGVVIDHEPLSAYRPWAIEPTGKVLAGAIGVRNQYNNKIRDLDWTREDIVKDIKEWIAAEVEIWLERDKVHPKAAAQALWWITHNSKSTRSQAALAYWAFWDECEWIVETKPGWKDKTVVVLTGMRYQTDHDELEIPVEIINYPENGLIRKAVLTSAISVRNNPPYPLNTLSLVSKESDQLPEGRYYAVIKPLKRTHLAELVPA